jgi:hypothetical protein
LVFRSGVGTQMMTASRPRTRPKSVVAVRRPAFTKGFSRSVGKSFVCDTPRATSAARRGSTSMPTTAWPASAKAAASGRPT